MVPEEFIVEPPRRDFAIGETWVRHGYPISKETKVVENCPVCGAPKGMCDGEEADRDSETKETTNQGYSGQVGAGIEGRYPDAGFVG